MPENALKLFYPSTGIRFEIKNKCHYLEAFQYIGQALSSSDKKIIYVEDILAKLILDKVLEDLNGEFPLMFEVIFLHGGGDTLYVKAATYSQENEKKKFILLDGDKYKPKINPSFLTLSESQSFDKLDEKIKETTGVNFKTLRFSIDGNEDSGDVNQKIELSLKYLHYLYSNLDYLPDNKIPEDIIWDNDFANEFLKIKSITNHVFSNDSKNNIFTFTELFTGDKGHASHLTCCKLFVAEFVRKKGVYYQNILDILNKFKIYKNSLIF